jgi:hypothetical protein
MKTYEIEIMETGRNHLRDKPCLFNTLREEFASLEKVRGFFLDRYGRIPNRRNKVYVDTKDGETKEVGFTYSYWNRDISHNSKHWYQTDWVTVFGIDREPITNHWIL